MGRLTDLTGKQFGRLTAQKRVGTKQRSPLWRCSCICGNQVDVVARSLLSQNTRSCGCLHKEQLAARNTEFAKHGMEGTRLYGVWHSMRQRCNDPGQKDYQRYGGRGIKVCKEWDSFNDFYKWAMANGYDEKAPYGICTLDRIDVDGNYAPENCRWVSSKIQANNRRVHKRRAYANN